MDPRSKPSLAAFQGVHLQEDGLKLSTLIWDGGVPNNGLTAVPNVTCYPILVPGFDLNSVQVVAGFRK